jgi:hypothetical protein
VVDEELVEVRGAAHPSGAEEACRWPGPDLGDETCEHCRLHCEPPPLGEPAPGAGKDEPRGSKQVVFTQEEVRGEVVGSPGVEERRSLWAEFVQQIAELLALDGIEEHVGHVGRM